MLVALIVAFLLLVSAAAANGHTDKVATPRHLALAAAGVLAFVVFGYTIGKDLAVRDNAAGCHAPTSAIEPSNISFKADGFAAA
jgi:hypothetical protein